MSSSADNASGEKNETLDAFVNSQVEALDKMSGPLKEIYSDISVEAVHPNAVRYTYTLA